MSILTYDSWILSFGSVEQKMNKEGKGGWYLEKDPSGWTDHLQEVIPSWWLFAIDWSIQVIICKRPVHQDDHLQETGLSGWFFFSQEWYICNFRFWAVARMVEPPWAAAQLANNQNSCTETVKNEQQIFRTDSTNSMMSVGIDMRIVFVWSGFTGSVRWQRSGKYCSS